MSKSTNLTRKWLLAGTILTTLAVGLPAIAQETTPPAEDTTAAPAAPEAAPADDNTTEIVVTGSRIRKSEFNSAAPVQVITAEKSSMSGMIDAAQILQSSSIASGSGQINNTFTGYVVDGGAGINTLSLRGLGAQRTLVLINGRRMPPAGVGGTVGPVDLNFIPQSMVSRYEILKDGASSIYGSDAVAGVVNIITTKNFDGFHIEASGLKSEKDGADSYTASAMYGKTFDKGGILISGEYFEQQELTYRDRPGLACPQLLRYSTADGSRADRIDPRTGEFKCYNASGVWGSAIIDNFSPLIGSSPSADFYFYAPNHTNGPLNNYVLYDGTASTVVWENDNPDPALDTTAISPVKRVSLFAQGQWRPDWLNGAELYTELMFGERKSSQRTWAQLFPYYSSHSSVNPLPHTPNADFPEAAYDYYGFGPAQPYAQPITIFESDASQKVDLGRFLGGVRGTLSSWNWDAYASYSKSVGKYDNTAIYADRVNWGTGFDQVNFVEIDECGAGAPAGCVPLNLFSPDAQSTGKLTQAEYDYYFTVDHGKTDYSQFTAEATATGDIMQLPAGALGAAFGISFRKDEINDVPGELARNGNSYNRTSAGITKGDDQLKEVYGELEVPIVRGKFLFEDLTLNLSGRYSDYDSVGSANTYKVGFNWALDNIFRVRGTAGTSFRAPALYELYLNDQTSYLSQSQVDPCINYDKIGADGEYAVNATIRANCAADGVAGDYTGAGSSAVLTTGGGLYLKPETSYATTLGFVLTPPDTGFKFAMDVWKTKISDQITSNGAAVVGACYGSVQFRSQPGFCDKFVRDLDPTSTTFNQILTIDASYRNIPTEETAGIDFTVSYEHEFNFGKLTSDAQFSWYKYYKSQQYEGAVIDDYVGTIGNPNWVGDVQTKFTHKDWQVAWTFNYTGAASNLGWYGEVGHNAANTYTYKASVPPFVTHDLEVRYRGKSFDVIAGINNVLDEYAPVIGDGLYSGSASRLGNYPFSSQYYSGLIGRQFYLNVSKDF
ncbi:TonB-dependent receptor plug domain-containing protein [Asticcacaulis taihuensis]|uniref:Iron complex outermembrane recepter protein n=1 Tax=Asticcacaulis taihuensis TaxID=260084 RepID=A0A1G4Q8L3_9CAUL|nr:TonB-dependent receptor [Asticcacaulis taihuensis]SCW40944.1 iron complex outermembrane recepter protein [Asticcacaulis taihuensis]